jgi:hypothetical protein
METKDFVVKTLMQHPHARNVEFHASDGSRTEVTNNGIFSILEINATLFLTNYEKLRVLVKCGTCDNFEKFGSPRQSLILGPLNDIIFERVIDVHVNIHDLILTGYKVGNGFMAPYCLVSWPLLLKRVHSGKMIIQEETNIYNGSRFAWVWAGSIVRCNTICNEIADLTRFGQLNEDPMKEK